MARKEPLPDDMPLDCEMAAMTLAAIQRALSSHADIHDMVRRRQRRMRPHPGGAAREMTIEIDDPEQPWDAIEMRLPQQSHGGSITTVHRTTGSLSLHSGHILGMPHVQLPDSVLLAAPGMAVGRIVDLASTGFAAIADAPIRTIMSAQLDRVLLFYLDVPTARPRMRDIRTKDPTP